jgi:hypothetical protein
VITPHTDPHLFVSGLRLLLDIYKLANDRFKDRKTPERVEEILTRAERSRHGKEEIERSLDALEPHDAEIVRNDLQLLSLLTFPTPQLDAFDYWGKLTALAKGLQTFAKEKRLFELRGENNEPFGEYLLLPTSGRCLLPLTHARRLAHRADGGETLKDVEGIAVLLKETNQTEFPIKLWVRARFYSRHEWDSEEISAHTCVYFIHQGQQKHWLKFRRPDAYYSRFEQRYEYRLDADDFTSIVRALRADIHECASRARADEEKVRPLFNAIDEFTKAR